MDLLESFSSRRLAMDPRRLKDAGTPSMWWKCRWDTRTGEAVPRPSAAHSCWWAKCFPCRRSPAADLLTINSPPLSCCGSRQPKLVPVLWTWGAALRDRCDAQVTDDVFWGRHRFKSLYVRLQMEKDETVSESSPHIANIGRLVEVSWTVNMFFFFLLFILTEKHWNDLNSVFVLY